VIRFTVRAKRPSIIPGGAIIKLPLAGLTVMY
jgi:hypothetical protein